MRTLTKKEWIAVVIAVVIVVILLGSKLINQANKALPINQTATVGQEMDQTQNISTSTATTTNNINKKMDQNTNTVSKGGLIIKDVVVGTGAEAKLGNLVDVQYTGKFADGKVFDSSIPRGQPIQFQLGAGQVIKGWDQGILGMKVGGKRTLSIPPELAYGPNGRPPVIPANSTLYFDVELVGVQVQ